jgi:hypothetical protein
VLVIDGKKNRKAVMIAPLPKLRRDSVFRRRRGPRDGLAGGEKVETFEHLENLLSQRDQSSEGKAQY